MSIQDELAKFPPPQFAIRIGYAFDTPQMSKKFDSQMKQIHITIQGNRIFIDRFLIVLFPSVAARA
jgi:hypothetical protein